MLVKYVFCFFVVVYIKVIKCISEYSTLEIIQMNEWNEHKSLVKARLLFKVQTK